MPAYGAREDDAFDVSAQTAQFVGVVAVVDAHDVLFDDRAGVEVLGHIVRSRADQLDAAVVGGLIRIGAYERGQKAVVNVDDARGVAIKKSALSTCI